MDWSYMRMKLVSLLVSGGLFCFILVAWSEIVKNVTETSVTCFQEHYIQHKSSSVIHSCVCRHAFHCIIMLQAVVIQINS